MGEYTDAELEELLRGGESDLCEFERELSGEARSKIRAAICAFSNDLPGHARAGVVFVGVDDDGSPNGLDIDDGLLLQLGEAQTDGTIVPPPSMGVRRAPIGGTPVAVIEVRPSDSPPVRYKGRILTRVGPRQSIATAQDERILNERRRHRDAAFDSVPVRSATLADLSRRRFEDEYLPNAVARDILEANDRSYEQRLAASKMIATVDDPSPTIVGLLVLGTRPRDFLPGAYVQFLKIRGTELSDDVVDEREIDGQLPEMIRSLDEKLESHNRVSVDFTSESTESRTYSYPMPALHQLTRNALMHRSYEGTHAPVRVTWFDDRVEITSPGGPFGAVTAENFGQPGVVDYRNPAVAEAMKVLGYVQRFGAGIQTARAALRKNGNPDPRVDVQPTWIQWTIEPS